jgi:hypothetical protein
MLALLVKPWSDGTIKLATIKEVGQQGYESSTPSLSLTKWEVINIIRLYDTKVPLALVKRFTTDTF